MLKYVVALLFIGLAWAIVLVLGLPWWIAAAFTVFVIVCLIALIVFRRLQARKAAREIERALRAQADEHARAVRPEQQAEIQAMQQEFQRAIGALQSSRLGRGADALAALPWYMIIGPPGSGKSTALRNSGLQFPYLSASGGGVRGVGGTRNCEWWLTNEAVLLDTAGRYTTEDEDANEWLAFLDLLRRNRPEKPLNGIIVAVSVGELGGAHEEEITALARRVRDRVDEVMTRLQMVMPVYVLFTKCDLVPGFVETFNDLTKGSRGQIWGFTVPLQTAGAPGDIFVQRFEELSKVIETRALSRASQERKIEVREKIWEFPQQFEVLKKNLADFVSTLFAQNVYQESPRMRGAYFTSGTQEGRPIDRVMNAMAEAFGIRGRLPQGEPVTEPKSYFLRDVFSRVVFPDALLAGRSAAEVRRQRVRIAAIAAVLFLVALFASVLPAFAWYKNSEIIDSTRDIVEDVGAFQRTAGGGPITLAKLEPLRQRVELLSGYEEDGEPIYLLGLLGMYHADDIEPHLRGYYANTLRRALFEPFVQADATDMETFGRNSAMVQSRPSGEEYARYYAKLKAHLLLTVPRDPRRNEPSAPDAPAEARQKVREWLTRYVVDRWARQLGVPTNATARAAMTQNVDLYVGFLFRDENLAFRRRGDVVNLVRQALTRSSQMNIAIDQIINEVDREGWDLTLGQMVGGTVSPLITANGINPNELARVRGAFTRKGWEERVRGRLVAPMESLVGEPWVLGTDATRTPEAERDRQIRELKSRYFRLYIWEWRQFLDAIRVDSPPGNPEALTMTQDLTRGEPPFWGRLMRSVDYNTTLLEEPPRQEGQSAIEAAAQGVIPWLQKRIGGATGRIAGQAARDALAGPGATPTDDLVLENQDVYWAFEGFTRFGVPPPAPPQPAPAPGAAPAPPPPPAPVALDSYQGQLTGVRDSLQTYLDNPNEPAPLLTKLQEARTTTRALIQSQEITWRPTFERLLWPPIEGSTRTTVGAGGSVPTGTGNRWCTSVVVPFERAMRNRYPYNPNGHDAALADMTEFYRPGAGLLWQFYDASLDRSVERVGDRHQFTTTLGTGAAEAYFPTLPIFLDRSQDIASVMFPTREAEAPRVDFEVRVRPTPRIEEILFQVDGQQALHRNAPEQWVRMRWPGEGDVRGALLRVKGEGIDETIQQDGEWGLFRLLEAGRMRGDPNARIFSIVWALRTHNVEIGVDIRPASAENPFLGVPRRGGRLRFLAPFRADGVYAPRDIARNGRRCIPAQVD